MSGAGAKIIWGPAFIGFIVCNFLYGITIAQSVYYAKNFPADKWQLKTLIGVLFILDSAHVALLADNFAAIFVRGRYDPSSLSVLPWQTPASILITGIVVIIVQSFYCLRVWLISKNWKLAVFIALLIVTESGFHLDYVSNTFTIRKEALNPAKHVAVTTDLVTNVVCDVIITASLVYYLRMQTSGAAGRAETIVQTVIVYCMNLGMLGCLTAFASFFLCVYMSPSYFPYSVAPQFVLSKCYVNSLLAILNARVKFRDMFIPTADITLQTFQSAVQFRKEQTTQDWLDREDSSDNMQISITDTRREGRETMEEC